MTQLLWLIQGFEDHGAMNEKSCLINLSVMRDRGEQLTFPITLNQVRPPTSDDFDWNSLVDDISDIFNCYDLLCNDDGGPMINITADQLRAFLEPTLDLSECSWLPTGATKLIPIEDLDPLPTQDLNVVLLNDEPDAGTGSITITHCAGDPTALITARGKDNDFGVAKLREIGYACLLAAARIEDHPHED